MSYAIRNDGIYGVRAVNDATECFSNEYFSDVFVKHVETITDKRAEMTLTPMRARLKLKEAGLLATVETAIAALPVDDDMRIMWEYTTSFERLNPVLIAFCTTKLGLSDVQIDGLFV